MNILGLFISGASLVVVIVVGCYSVLLGRRAAVAAEKSAEASMLAAKATERSVQASERAAALAAGDAKYRRAEALLDVVLEMRELLNSQNLAHEGEVRVWQPQRGSDETLRRIALRRKLEGRLVSFQTEASNWTSIASLFGNADYWMTSVLDAAILEVTSLMESVGDEQNSYG